MSEKFNYKKLNETLNNFKEEIIKYISKDNLYLFYKNIKNLRILTSEKIEDNNYYIPQNIASAYFIKYNCIILRNNFEKTIYHELFHLASSKNITYSGFSISKDNISLGVGLTEGYTQYLTEKYFKDKDIIKSYKCETQIAKNLEIIIGKEKMQSLYFSANLIGLIKELKKYNTLDNIYSFLRAVDNIYDNNLNINIDKKIESINITNQFLIETFINKEKLQTKKVTKENYMKFLVFTTQIPTSININNQKYQLNKLDSIIKKKLKPNS